MQSSRRFSSFIGKFVGAGYLGVFLGASRGKEFFADKALTHVLTDHDEDLADLVVSRGLHASLNVFVNGQI